MPTKLKLECAKLKGWGEASVGDRLWTAYVRSPEYLYKYGSDGRYGVAKSKIPNEINEYYDWIYAPLIKINPKIERNLKKILFIKNLNDEGGDMNPDRYYWDIQTMHTTGTDRVKKMPSEMMYNIVAIEKIPTLDDPANKSLVATVKQMLVKHPVDSMALKTTKTILKHIIDDFFIPKQPKTQTGWKKSMFKNNDGYIAIFIYDFNNSNNNFLNWGGNPFA